MLEALTIIINFKSLPGDVIGVSSHFTLLNVFAGDEMLGLSFLLGQSWAVLSQNLGQTFLLMVKHQIKTRQNGRSWTEFDE